MQSESQLTCSAEGLRIAIVVSDYHNSITERLSIEAKNTFIRAGGLSDDCILVHADGSWELPILAKAITNDTSIDAIVALGCIITGETTHDRVISDAIVAGLMNVALEWGHPVSMGILTCQTMKQAEDRAGGSSGNKGAEAMRAAIGTVTSLKVIQS